MSNFEEFHNKIYFQKKIKLNISNLSPKNLKNKTLFFDKSI